MDLSKNLTEIERKFLFKGALDSSIIIGSPRHVYRHYLYTDGQIEVRIQKKNENEYELERRIQDPKLPLKRRGMKMPISKAEFDRFTALSVGHPIQYKKYQTKVPNIFLKEYEGVLSGLILVEVEFNSETEAHDFHPEIEWIGHDVSESTYTRDSGLIHIESQEELKEKLDF